MGGRRYRGFTLLELMMAIAVIGVLAAIAVPSFNTFRLNSRMTSAANDLLTSFNFARSEAIKRQRPVGICTSSDPRAGTPTCGGQLDNATAIGWVVWLDQDGDAGLDGGEEILSAHDTLDPQLGISSNWQVVNYLPTGFAQIEPLPASGVPAALLVCDQRGNDSAGDQMRRRILTVSPTGRPAVIRTVEAAASLEAAFADEIPTECPP